MTYPIIRWSGGGGGILRGIPATVRLGDGQFVMPPLLTLDASAMASSVAAIYAARAAAVEGAADEPGAPPPSEATLARCRCLVESAGDVDASVAASAIEACAADPQGFTDALAAADFDVSVCAGGGGGEAPLWQNPWVIGGAAALVLGGLAFVALR